MIKDATATALLLCWNSCDHRCLCAASRLVATRHCGKPHGGLILVWSHAHRLGHGRSSRCVQRCCASQYTNQEVPGRQDWQPLLFVTVSKTAVPVSHVRHT